MTKQDIKNKVFDILSELSGIDNFSETDKLQEDLGLDSLGLVTLLLSIEDAFEIILEADDMNPFELISVNDVIILAEKYNGL